MAYDWATAFANSYAQDQAIPYEGYAQDKMRYDMEMQKMQAQLQMDLQKLRATSEYTMMDAKQKQQMEAQLIAYRAGQLPPDMAAQMVTGQTPQYEQEAQMEHSAPYAPETEGLLDNALGGAAGYALGSKYLPKGSPQMAMDAMAKVGGTMKDNGLSKGASKKLEEMALKGFKTNAGNVGKYNNNVLSKLLTKGAVGAKRNVAIKGAEKGLGSVMAKVGSKALPKMIGGMAGGPVGLAAGFIVPEIIDAMYKSDEEKAREQYLRSMY